MARVLMILALCGVLGCQRSADVPSGPDQDWQALLKSQEEEIHRLEAENARLRAQCREGAPLTEAADSFPEMPAEASSSPPSLAQQQPRPTVSRFSVTSPLSAGGRVQLVWKARIGNASEEAEKVAAIFEAFDENGISLAQWTEEATLPAAQAQDLTKQRIVSGLTKPVKVVLTLRSRWGDSKASATVLDTSPFDPTETTSQARGESRLVALISPRVKYTLPEDWCRVHGLESIPR